jgi:hypothetical protein
MGVERQEEIMAKKKKSEPEVEIVAMTPEEKVAWSKSVIAANLAQHYEEMAQHYMMEYAKMERHFWEVVKKRQHLPKQHFQMTVMIPHEDKIKIEMITDEQHRQRYVKKPDPKLVVD